MHSINKVSCHPTSATGTLYKRHHNTEKYKHLILYNYGYSLHLSSREYHQRISRPQHIIRILCYMAFKHFSAYICWGKEVVISSYVPTVLCLYLAYRRYIEKMQKLNTLIIFTLFVCFFDISEARRGFPLFIILDSGGE